MRKLTEAAILALERHDVTREAITSATVTFLENKYQQAFVDCDVRVALDQILAKDEVADILLTGIFLDEQAGLLADDHPLKSRLARDANGHNVDEILAIGITQQVSAAATVHYGLLDDLKPGIIGEINDRQDCVNVYLDDLVAALIAATGMHYLNICGGNQF